MHPKFWRYVLHTTESFIKQEQPWPVNLAKREEEEKKRAKAEVEEQGRGKKGDAKEQPKQQEEGGKKDTKPEMSFEEAALLKCLQYEQKYRSSMRHNDGRGRSPFHDEALPEQIDEADQFSPDSWVPRSKSLKRLTGKHPMNAEADLTTLFNAGLITPSPIHYVRNHGAVPHLLWENHKLDVVVDKQLTFGMDELIGRFNSINIPIFLACDGSRRKELNMIKRTRGFNFTTAAAGCSYWKGVLLRDVLLEAGAIELMEREPEKCFWVHYKGADQLGEGEYATCVPLSYVMDTTNDVLLAYEMNDHPIPPDHGYPLRLMLPGWVGARSIKWLTKVWVTEFENDSYYHIYDNRQLPSFVTDAESETAKIMYHHPSTLCTQQMLNSVIVKPSQGEKINLADMKKGKTYRIEGFAYNGGGNEIDRVEVSLNGGDTWLYCVRKVSVSLSKPFLHNWLNPPSILKHQCDMARSSGPGYIGTLTSTSQSSLVQRVLLCVPSMSIRTRNLQSRCGTLKGNIKLI